MSVDCPLAKRGNDLHRGQTACRQCINEINIVEGSNLHGLVVEKIFDECPGKTAQALRLVNNIRVENPFFSNFIVYLLSFPSSKFLPIHTVYSMMARQMFLAHGGGKRVKDPSGEKKEDDTETSDSSHTEPIHGCMNF